MRRKDLAVAGVLEDAAKHAWPEILRTVVVPPLNVLSFLPLLLLLLLSSHVPFFRPLSLSLSERSSASCPLSDASPPIAKRLTTLSRVARFCLFGHTNENDNGRVLPNRNVAKLS